MSVEVFCCYAHEDKGLLKKLKRQLMPLQRQGLITIWNDADISPGAEWEEEINKHLNTARIILLLVSPDFMASDYCYSKEMKRAMERHEEGEACVIPIILRPVHWQGAPFGKLQALPKGHRVRSDYWRTLDHALYEVVDDIRTVIEKLNPVSTAEPPKTPEKNPEHLHQIVLIASEALMGSENEPDGNSLEANLFIFRRKDQESDYIKWVQNHRNDGFIVVKDGPRWRLHRPNCHFVTDPIEKGQSLITYPKICSTQLSMIKEEAKRHSAALLTSCYCQKWSC